METITAPGSAIPGQPASESRPIEVPSKHGSRYELISSCEVNLFKGKSTSSSWFLLGLIFFIKRRAIFSFSTIKWVKSSTTFFMESGNTSKGALSPSGVGMR